MHRQRVYPYSFSTSRTPPRARAFRVWLIRCCLLAGLLIGARPAGAVIILMKSPGPPIRGFLVRQTGQTITLRQVLQDGETKERTIARSEIDQVIQSVSSERLATLDPKQPDAYREYAEELSEKRKDPDARATAIRLYLIAAHLAPDRLGRSAMLGLIPLARSDQEQRRFRAMAYLLDPAHDRALLNVRRVVQPPSSTLDAGRGQAMVRALRLLRQGQRRQALSQAKRSHLDENLPKLTTTISYKEFEQACANVCPHCTRGYVTCPKCGGKKTVPGPRAAPTTCPTCAGTGHVVCPFCHGSYRDNPLSHSLLRRILLVELAWLAPGSGSPDSTERNPVVPMAGWGHAVARGHTAPILPLRLATLTEIDPAACRYRDGKWVR